MQDYCNISMDTSLEKKKWQRRIIWSYYLLRNFSYYRKATYHVKNLSYLGEFDGDLIQQIIVLILFQEMSARIYDQYMQSIRAQNSQLSEMFKSTLDVIPNGVLLIDLQNKTITFANREMEEILGATGIAHKERINVLREKVEQFIRCEQSNISTNDNKL
jgi:PAS domain-containing protein